LLMFGCIDLHTLQNTHKKVVIGKRADAPPTLQRLNGSMIISRPNLLPS